MFRRLSSVATVCRSIFAASAKYRLLGLRVLPSHCSLFIAFASKIFRKNIFKWEDTEKIEAQKGDLLPSKPHCSGFNRFRLF
jgi:hypothetical protein